MYFVTAKQLLDYFELENLTPDIPYENRKITESDVNRPALQLAGFFDYFVATRVQIIGKVESTYLAQIQDEAERKNRIERFMVYNQMPCIILCLNELEADPYMLECAKKSGIPIFKSHLSASTLLAEVNTWLNYELALRTTIHGILIDVYGEGVLITGESGIGKSETALELVRRGHRLVADDAVEIKKVSATTLIGSAPEVIRHFIEVRGIGIMDVKQLYGVGAIKERKEIDMVIKCCPAN